VFGLLNGSDPATQYFAGYLVELSLSVDNLFVFVIIIGSFAVPVAQQPKTLTTGIAVALGLRAGSSPWVRRCCSCSRSCS